MVAYGKCKCGLRPVIALKYGVTHIPLMSIVLSYSKRLQLDCCMAQVVLPTEYSISLWSSLPVELTNTKTIRSFRHRSQTIIMNE